MNEKVLIVDDDPEQEQLAEILRTAGGYQVTLVSTFWEANQVFERLSPDILITEVRLAAFNGLHLITRWKSVYPKLVAIVHTAFPDSLLEKETRNMGADFMLKGVSIGSLLRVISSRLNAV